MPTIPHTAMILAAGKGTRMMPLTKDRPKACVKVSGKMMVDYVIDRAVAAGIKRFVINAHYFGEVLKRELEPRSGMEYIFSDEDELLETGGGVRQALGLLGAEPFYVLNCDSLWLDGPGDLLKRLAVTFDAAKMDGLLALYPHYKSTDYNARADFMIAGDGQIKRPKSDETPAHIFMGASILTPALFKGCPDAGAFSLNRVFDSAMVEKRLYGLVHDGLWYHVSTPEDVSQTELSLRLL
ncbi:MAG: nucleotidyltransferase family protein [Holosporales bacterium]